MEITESINEGLKRELKIVIASTDMGERLEKRLDELKTQVRLNGFRPGRIPKTHLHKIYGKSAMAEIINDILQKVAQEVPEQRGEKPLTQPEVNMSEDEQESEKVLRGQADFEFSMSYEIKPEITLPEFAKMEIERAVLEIDDEKVDEQILKIAKTAQIYKPKEGKAEKGDQILLSYHGKIDGKPFKNGSDENAQLVLGDNLFIPGFEDPLIGTGAGDETCVKLTFPKEYKAESLAGQDAEFEVTIKEVRAPVELEINDELAKRFGLESISKLREIVCGQLENRYDSYSRARSKRQIFDHLDEKSELELPQEWISKEFDAMWEHLISEMESNGKTFEQDDTTEDKAREKYKKLAERRIRIGLVMSEIGEKANIQVSREDVQEKVQSEFYDGTRSLPDQEKMAFNYLKKNPDAASNIHNSIFERKVVDHIMTLANVVNKTVTKEELLQEDNE